MTIENAIKHFEFKLKNSWKPTATDIQAYNAILEYKTKKDSQQFIDNQLFGKLYITYYGELLKYYRATVFDKQPQKDLEDVLSDTIEKVIQDFIIKANDVERALEYTIEGVLKHPLQWTEQDKANINMKKPPNIYDETVDNLTAMVNNAINKYNK